jgi:hypothetical protein
MKNRVIGFSVVGLLVVCLLGYARYESTHRVVVDESIFREDFENDKKVINELLENKFVWYDEIEDVVRIREEFTWEGVFKFEIGNKQLGVVGDSGNSWFYVRINSVYGDRFIWDKLILKIDGKRKEYDMSKYERKEYTDTMFYLYYTTEVKNIFGRSDLDEILRCDKILFRMSGMGKFYDGEIKGGELKKVKEMITIYNLIDKNKYFVGLDNVWTD